VTTRWNEILRAVRALRLAQMLLRKVPGLSAVAVAGAALFFQSWSCQHQAQEREMREARQIEKRTGAEISRLKQQAAGALRDAQQSAENARQLESQRQRLEREAAGLRQKLAALRGEEQASGVRLQGPGQEEQVSGVKDQAAGPLGLFLEGAKKSDSGFPALDICRQEGQVMGQQIANCEGRVKLNSALVEQQSSEISKLQTALAAQSQMLARREAAHRAELEAVRGRRRSRWARAAVYFAGGFAAGVLVR